MGNANEPPKGSPSLELLELKLVLATDDDPLMQRAGLKQDPISLKMFDVFEDEHPEILMRSTFFVTRKEGSCFKEAEELTVVYGNQYKRTYSTWGHAGTPLRYHVPHDQWAEGVWENWSQYPERCPGWFNPDQQPLNRPVFARVPNSDHEVTILPDLPAVVAARKLGLDGDAAAQRLAKLEQLIWPRQLPLLPEQEAEPADGGKKNVKRPAKASSSAEADENPFVPFQVPVMERFAAGALTAFYDWPKRSLLDSGGPPTEVIPQAQTRRVGGVPTFPRLVPRMADASTLSAPPPEDDQASGKTEPPSSASALRGLPAIEQFELPSVLQNINRDELGRLVKAEECIRAREDHGLEDGLPELTELDWNSPWRFPLGSIVWCKMAGYPCWPAEVCSPAVNDQDIARQRCEGEVFVRFFGWAHSKNDYLYAPAETLMTWEEGVERGLLASKHSKKATDDTLQMAKVEALAALRARPQPQPVEPPPWWEVRFAGELDMREEGCGSDDEDEEGGEEGDEEEDEEERYERDERASRLKDANSRMTRRSHRPKALFQDVCEEVDDEEEEEEGAGDEANKRKRDSVAGAAAPATAHAVAGRLMPDAATLRVEDEVAHAMATERGQRGPSGTPSEGWQEWLTSTVDWGTSAEVALPAGLKPTEGGSRAVAYKSHGRVVKAGVKGGATTKTPVSPKKATKRKEPPETPKPSRGGTRRDPTSEASSLTSLFNMETPDSRKGKKPKVAPTPPAAKMTGLFQARKPGNRPSPRSK